MKDSRPCRSAILPRVALVAFALGLSVAGPQIGSAAADNDSPTGTADRSGSQASARESHAARGTRVKSPRTTLVTQPNDSPTSGPMRSRRAVLVQHEPTAIEAGEPRPTTGPAVPPAVTLPAAAPPESVAEGPDPIVTGNLLSDALTGHSPAAPTDILGWAMLAAASRETFAIPQTPLFTALRLQYVPIIGPLLVTPIVTAVSQIPVLSDLLHPVVGYPLVPEGFAAPRDVFVVSFDGTRIYAHFMPASGLRTGQSAPTVMVGPGLGTPGATNINGTPLDGNAVGTVGIATLRDAGYNVVTWDPRGEFSSGGVLQMDSPDAEARDASARINWIAAQADTQLDGPGDPRLGMVGPSYGGGIQLVTAATDHRVDAIVPTVAWNSLDSAMAPNGAYKSGWGTLLGTALALTLVRADPMLFRAGIYGDLTGQLTPAYQAFFAQPGPGVDLVSHIKAPTLLIQGTVDTLFSLKQADLTATTLLAQGVPTKVLWFCGGHGVCLNKPAGDGVWINQRIIEWLDHYVKAQPNVPTGPQFEWVDQRGQHFSATTYSLASAERIVASVNGKAALPLVPFVGGSGPLLGVLPIGGTKALNAIDLTTPASATTAYIVGEPELTMSYSGIGVGDHVYGQLVDDTTGLVLGNQVTPIPVTLDGRTHTISIAMQPVAHTLGPGETLTLQLFAWSADYAANRALGALSVEGMRITLPTNGTPNRQIQPVQANSSQ